MLKQNSRSEFRRLLLCQLAKGKFARMFGARFIADFFDLFDDCFRRTADKRRSAISGPSMRS